MRMDSAPLLETARQARRMLDEAGLAEIGLFASGGLDELDISELVRAGAPIDADEIALHARIDEARDLFQEVSRGRR